MYHKCIPFYRRRRHHVAYRKALAWLGHLSSEMLDLYYHLHDEDCQQAMLALAGGNGMNNREFGEANSENRKQQATSFLILRAV